MTARCVVHAGVWAGRPVVEILRYLHRPGGETAICVIRTGPHPWLVTTSGVPVDDLGLEYDEREDGVG